MLIRCLNRFAFRIQSGKDQDYEMYLFFAYIGLLLLVLVLSLIPEQVTPVQKVARDELDVDTNTSHLASSVAKSIVSISQMMTHIYRWIESDAGTPRSFAQPLVLLVDKRVNKTFEHESKIQQLKVNINIPPAS